MEESKLLGVSIRGWLAIMITLTVCGMAMGAVEVKQPLHDMALLALGFYFGQKTITPNGGGTHV